MTAARPWPPPGNNDQAGKPTSAETGSMAAARELQGATQKSAEECAGPVSRLLFWWVEPHVKAFFEQAVGGSFALASLPPIPSTEKPEEAIAQLAFEVRREIELLQPGNAAATSAGKGRGGRKPSLHRALFRCWWPVMAPHAALSTLCAVLFTLPPLLLRVVVWAMRGEVSLYAGCAAVFGISALGVGGGLLQQRTFHAMTALGRSIWVQLVGNTFDKLAHLDSTAFGQHFSEGQVVSMIGQDASHFPYMSPFFAIFMVMPFNILLPAIVLFIFLGRAFAVGFAVCLLISFISDRSAAAYKRRVTAKLKAADERLLIVNEALQGIRSVKLCAWETAIEARAAKARDEELKLLLWIHLCYALQQGVVSALPVIACVATLLTHAALDNELEAGTVAMVISYFEQLTLGFLLLPNSLMQLKMMSAGINRFGRLLLEPDSYTPRTVTLSPGQAAGIDVVNASFQWHVATASGLDEGTSSKNSSAATQAVAELQLKPQLQGVSLAVRPGELVAVVGRVGSGKSTFAAGLFGLARRVTGHMAITGRAAYVPQSPQILNASLRDNILFGADFDTVRYRHALAACCLRQDLKQLPDGDATEIGEKGITISGGQRARVALARAYFSDADVVVLDDPLSAMDAYVGSQVFRKCVLELRRRGKAVLLITNQLPLAASADQVLVLEDGRVAEHGTFEDLAARAGGRFAIMLRAAAEEVGETGDGLETHNTGVSSVSSFSASASPTDEEDAVDEAAPDEVDAPGDAQQHGINATSSRTGIIAEVAMQGRIGLKEWLRISSSGKSCGLGGVLFVACMLVPILMYFNSITLGVWTSAASEEPGGALDAERELALYICAGVLFALCCGARVVTAAFYFVRVSRHLHRRMLASVLRQPLVWYDTTPLGRILNRFSQDVALADLQMPRLFEFTNQHFCVVLVGVVGAGVLAWPALLILLPLVWPLRQIQQRNGAVSLHLQRIMLQATSPVLTKTAGFLTALDTIRAFGSEAVFATDFRKAIADYVRSYYWIHVTDRLIMSLLTVICVPVLTFFLGLAVLPLARVGFISPELGGLALALSSGLAQRIPLFFWCASTLEKFFGGAQRMAEYADLPWEGSPADHEAWRSRPSCAASGGTQDVGDRPMPAMELENIHLRYQPDLPLVLKGLSLKVWPAESIGVCGRTGSGKSTLFLACFRMVEPDEGRILVGGREASAVPLPELRSQLAIVPQDPLIFSGTLRANLDFHGLHSDEEIWEALRLAKLESQIQASPQGLDAIVKEKGSNFSQGTVQLLCIARILLSRQRVVFLDECTASVDYKTDAAVQAAVRSAFKDCAVISIAHRLHTIIECNRIACLDAGRVAECGPAHELLQLDGGIFAGLVDSAGEAEATELRRRAAAVFAKGEPGLHDSSTSAPSPCEGETSISV